MLLAVRKGSFQEKGEETQGENPFPKKEAFGLRTEVSLHQSKDVPGLFSCSLRS